MAELRKDSLSFLEALGQSVANLSPTLTPAVAITVVAAMAGTASWLVYLLATISLVIVGINIGKLASKISAAGSFFIYVSRTLGPFWGMLCGWAMLAAYIFTAMALTAGTSTVPAGFGFGCRLRHGCRLSCCLRSSRWWSGCSRFATSAFTSRLGLTVEVISVSIILLICFISLKDHGFALDTKQLKLEGASFGSIAQAIVFGIFCYVGFEAPRPSAKKRKTRT